MTQEDTHEIRQKKNHKIITRLFSVLFLLAVTFTSSAPNVDAVNATNRNVFTTDISSNEVAAMIDAMETRGMGNNISVEILYDCDNEPTFLLGTSDLGYQIIARGTLRCIEGGEVNPYLDYPNNKKYYGGVLNYFVESGDNFYDITHNTTASNLLQAEYLEEATTGIMSASRAVSNQSAVNVIASPSAASNADITYSTIIPNADIRIQRRAFGLNNDDTCSAVACTIVLNYLDYEDGDIVPSEFHLEALASDDSPENIAEEYPSAHAFHRYLVEDCDMVPASFAGRIATSIDMYRDISETVSDTGIACDWTVNIYTNFGIDELNADRPAMLTSTIAGDYSTHTMPIYGYRRYSDGSLEWLVHTGWYSSLKKGDDEIYYMPEVWVAASTATLLYRFTYEGM